MIRKDPRTASAAACALLLGIAAYYLWSASSSGNPFLFARQPQDHYGLLTDALLAGRLHVPRAPDPGLLALPDPYDNIANRAFRIPNVTHDLSLYRGRFYVYFGAAPVATLFGPFRWVTGRHLPENLALAIFLAAGFLASLATLRRLAGGPIGSVMTASLVLLLGLCNYAPFLLRRPRSYEVAIAAGACFALLGVHALLRGLPPEPRFGWLTWASAAFGLAFASRPTQGLCAALLLAGSALVLAGPRGARRVRLLAALWLPWLALVALVLLYNRARFDDAFEFGIRYQLTEWNQHRLRMFSWAFLPFNVRLNLLAPPMLGPEFPFFRLSPASLPPPPDGYQSVEAVAGLLPCLPASVASLFWPALWSRGPSRAAAWTGVALALQSALLALPVLCFGVASVRYQLDFLPFLLLSAALAWVRLHESVALRRAARTGLVAGFASLVAYSASLNLAVGLTGYYDWLRRLNAQTYVALEDAFLPFQRLWLALGRSRYGPARITLRLPERGDGGSETLLAAGGLYRHDVVCVRYPDEEHVVFAFHHRGSEPIRSRRLRLRREEAHVIEVEMGSLLPVSSRVLARLWPAGPVQDWSERFTLKVDGVEALSGRFDFIPSMPQQVTFGADLVGNDQCEAAFSGRIERLERQMPSWRARAPLSRAAWPPHAGRARRRASGRCGCGTTARRSAAGSAHPSACWTGTRAAAR